MFETTQQVPSNSDTRLRAASDFPLAGPNQDLEVRPASARALLR